MEIGEETEDQIDPIKLLMNMDTWPELPPTDAVDDGEYSDMLLVGFVIVNVVGLQHYQGTVSGRELVALIRDELNPHDSRTINVLNMVSMRVGYIERFASAVLSPLIDAGYINVEGIVPKREGRGSKYRIPCQVHIFARKEEFGRVEAALHKGGLELISDNSASFTLSEAMAVKAKNGFTGVKRVDEIFKQLEMQVRKKGVLKALEPPTDLIKTELFLHQKEGLGWLFSRENSIELPPFWVEKNGVYVNELTNFQTNKRPKPFRGGIFADDMGLGKTLTLLSLIAFDKSANSSALKRKTEDLSANIKGKGPALDRLEPNTTLIVCPPSVISSWITELDEHTVTGSFKVYLYYGERTKDIEELKKHDIVLTTYSTLASEGSKDESPIKGIEWRRVILDEAHVIKNAKTNQSRTVTNLNAKRRWAITGTPMPNKSFDLFSLVNFLKLEPLSMKSLWRSLIERPLAQGDDKGFSRLQVLMAAVSLRRTKEKGLAGLPSKTIETVFVDLREDERKIYEEIEAESKLMDSCYQFVYFTHLSILVRLRQACNDLALCPNDLRNFFRANRQLLDTNVKNPKLLEKLLSVLQDGEDFDCPICMNPPTDVMITCCAHIFCKSCIMTAMQTRPYCPMCRRFLYNTDLFTAPSEPLQTASTEGPPSSKVTALLKLLSDVRDTKPSSKSVIFSQFQKMLIILEVRLKEAGFKVARLDGSMNAKRRIKVIKEFGIPSPDGPTIMLASLKACNAGINLTAASTVYLLEPWWNPAVEDQAMDRVHRIGQKEDVKVVRLLARNTVEEKVLKLQEKKRMLAKNAFGGRNQNDLRKLNEDDFASLFNS